MGWVHKFGSIVPNEPVILLGASLISTCCSKEMSLFPRNTDYDHTAIKRQTKWVPFVFCNVLRIGTSLDVRVVQTCLSGNSWSWNRQWTLSRFGTEWWYGFKVYFNAQYHSLWCTFSLMPRVFIEFIEWYRQCLVFSFLYRLDTSMPSVFFIMGQRRDKVQGRLESTVSVCLYL